MTELQQQPGKLPIPPVKDTMRRYLEAVETFTPQSQMEKTSRLVEEFLADEEKIEAITKLLQERSESLDSWAYQWWLEDMYLNNMLPLPVNSSPGWVFPKKCFQGSQDMLKYIVELIKGITDFKQQLESNALPEELAAGRSGGPKLPLCMLQYERLLNSYRHPGQVSDQLTCTDALTPRDNEHIIVMANSHMYKMAIKLNGGWLDKKVVLKLLGHIYQDFLGRDELPLNEKIPLLTSDKRSEWFKARQLLVEDNLSNLETIETSLFAVCLDQSPQNVTDKDRSHKDMFRQMLTGGGWKYNGANRWFDKTVQIVVSPDGVNGMCYEHTASEGVAVVTAMLNVFKKMENEANDDDQNKDDDIEVDMDNMIQQLDWVLTEDVKQCVLQAAENLDKLDGDMDVEVFAFANYGKSFVKTCNCSPDAYMQMGLQLSYFRVHGGLCSTYESASTRRFRRGRVDSIRASHPAALAWVKAMEDKDVGKEDKKGLLRQAIKAQTVIMKENIFGEGVDVPLLGIRRAAEALWPSEALPVFTDQTFSNANLFKLSTSQVPINLPNSYMGYGAVVPDGYGVAYNLQDQEIIFAIASFFSCLDTCSRKFSEAVQQSLEDMKDLFQD